MTIGMSKISVIIPAYNHGKYIQETIQSIIDQTYENIELLIIDDGSIDNTHEKILEMKEICHKRFKRFYVETQKNAGTCITLNKLIEKSQGDYIMPIASDDKVLPDAVNVLHDFLSKNDDYALVVGENLIMDSQGNECYWDKDRNIIYNKEEAYYKSFSDFLIKITPHVDFLSDNFGSYESLLVGNYIPNGYLIRKNIFEKTGLYTKEAPLEDYYMNLQIAKYSKMKYIPIPTFYYRWHENNTITQTKQITIKDRQTRLFDSELTKKSKDKRLIKILNDYIDSSPKKYKIKIPFIFEFYKIETMAQKYKVIKILGMKFMYSKKYTE